MRILVVDDNEDNRLMLRRLLASNGHEVMEAPNGQAGLELAQDLVPDMIISDILMPVMNGFRFCHTVRHLNLLRKVPFVIYSAAFTSSQDKRLAADLGVNLFVEKPADLQQFLRQIETLPHEFESSEQKSNGAMHLLAGRIERQLDDMLDAQQSELKRSKRSLTTLIKNLPGIVYRCRNDDYWTMEFISDSFRELTGYEPSDLIDNRRFCFRELMRDDEYEAARAEFELAVKNGVPFNLTYHLKTASGEELLFKDHGRVAEGAGDEALMEGYMQNVTAQGFTERALAKFFEITRDLIIVADRDGVISQANSSWSGALGWQAEDLIGRPFTEFVHPDDREETRTEFTGLDDGRQLLGFKNRFLSKQGDFRTLDWSVCVDTDAGMILAIARVLSVPSEVSP